MTRLLWCLHNSALKFIHAPIDHKEDTILGLVAVVGLIWFLAREIT